MDIVTTGSDKIWHNAIGDLPVRLEIATRIMTGIASTISSTQNLSPSLINQMVVESFWIADEMINKYNRDINSVTPLKL